MKIRKKASLTKRIFANVIDYLIFALVFSLYAVFFGEDTVDGYKITGLMLLPIALFWFLYFVIIEGFYQATFGHQLLNITVRQVNHKQIDIGHSFKRRIIDIIDLSFLGIPALIAVSTNHKKQRLGDMFAKTIVLEDEYEDES